MSQRAVQLRAKAVGRGIDPLPSTGLRSFNILRLSGTNTDTQTVTIGRDVYELNLTGGITAGRIAVAPADGTNTLFSTALANKINERVGVERHVRALRISASIVLIYTDAPISIALACSETLTNGAFQSATMIGGAPAPSTNVVVAERAPVAAEVTAGEMYFVVPFRPIYALTIIRTTSSGAIVAWDGALAYGANYIMLDNGGNTDWSVNETVAVLIFGA